MIVCLFWLDFEASLSLLSEESYVWPMLGSCILYKILKKPKLSILINLASLMISLEI